MVDGLKQLAKKSCFGSKIADYKHMQPQTEEAALYREIYNTFYGRITAPLVKDFFGCHVGPMNIVEIPQLLN